MSDPLTIGQCAALATIIEATAPKPGNVHRGADFEDLSYPDFIVAATLTTPAFDASPLRPLGQTVLSAVRAMRGAVYSNTSLGTILLLAPLASVPLDQELRPGVRRVLAALTADDARLVYEAICAAGAGGLGRVADADVHGPPPADLLAAMRLAAERDMVARQYAEGFHHVFDEVVPWLQQALARGLPLADSVVHVHLQTMSKHPDSLIARKRGLPTAERAASMAAAVLAAGLPRSEAYEQTLADFDFWLRSDHHRRNPGTTADLLAAALFVALREGIIQSPFRLAR